MPRKGGDGEKSRVAQKQSLEDDDEEEAVNLRWIFFFSANSAKFQQCCAMRILNDALLSETRPVVKIIFFFIIFLVWYRYRYRLRYQTGTMVMVAARLTGTGMGRI